MSDPSQFHLRVTAGPSYSEAGHKAVPVNTDKPIHFSNDTIDASLTVRIQNYRGLPKDSPETCQYFQHAPHQSDLYSISFAFVPKKEIPGTQLLFGNDFDKPIKDRLPPGFNAALKAVKWFIDPGIDGDVYAEKPYLFGPLLSSINVLNIGDQGASSASETQDQTYSEGGSQDGNKIREDLSIPSGSSQRMKYFLTEEKRKQFTFEPGREYRCDFFNPYLDFNELALKVPGVTLHLMRFWDGQPLRYVLKQKGSDGIEKELLVVVFTLVPAEEAEKETQSQQQETNEDPAPASEEKKGESKFVDEDID